MAVLILIGILAAVVLELGKHTLLGWFLTAGVLTAFGILRKKYFWRETKKTRRLAWLGLFAAVILANRVSVPPVRPVPASDAAHPEATGEITIAQGSLTGVYTEDKKVEVYVGIPYAQPPVGDLRWKEPQEPLPWDGTLVCDHFAPMFMQPSHPVIYDSLSQIIGYHDYIISLSDNFVAPMSEDALYLNIWKPAGDISNAPVILYIHGGSLQTGQPWYQDYNGAELARRGCVVVNCAYRLGVFGYHADEELAKESPNGTTGDYGLLDQIQALKWVGRNISAFGGNPDNITIAGESAGSASVSAICTSPLAKGLFRRAILESSTVSAPEPAHSYRLMDQALEDGKKVKEETGCSTIAELRKLPAEKLARYAAIDHHITIDGYALEKTPCQSYKDGEHNEEALLHGYNKEESAPFLLFDHVTKENYGEKLQETFGPYADQVQGIFPSDTDDEAKRNYRDIFTADWFSYGHYCLTRQALANDIPVWEYYFTKDNGRLGSWHSGEEVYCYGNIPDDSGLYDTDDRSLSDLMLTYWVNFARTGDPNKSGIVDAYGSDSGGTTMKGQKLPVWKPVDSIEEIETFGAPNKKGRMVYLTREKYLEFYDVLDKIQGWDQPK